MESTGVSSAATSQKKYQVHTEEVHKLHRERQKKEMAVVKGGKLLCFYVKGVMLFIFQEVLLSYNLIIYLYIELIGVTLVNKII